jgi:hypothetical protein
MTSINSGAASWLLGRPQTSLPDCVRPDMAAG